jgi:hypothetical protein
MDNNQLTQDEIDKLLKGYSGDMPGDITGSSTGALPSSKEKAATVKTCLKRLDFLRETRADLHIIHSAKIDLHNAAFSLWCANHGMSYKEDYYARIRVELKRRGLRYVGSNPPGYKLVKVN